MGGQGTLTRRRRPIGFWAALGAAVLAFVYAIPNVYWALGGEALLSTVGGSIEDVARDGGTPAFALGLASAGLKIAGGFLALGLAFPEKHQIPLRLLTAVAMIASVVLVLYGGALVTVGALVLTDVIEPGTAVDLAALRWHVLLWDPWFLIWGLLLGIAAYDLRRHPPEIRP